MEVSRIEISHQTDVIAVVHGCSFFHHRPHIVRRIKLQNLLGDDLMAACSYWGKTETLPRRLFASDLDFKLQSCQKYEGEIGIYELTSPLKESA